MSVPKGVTDRSSTLDIGGPYPVSPIRMWGPGPAGSWWLAAGGSLIYCSTGTALASVVNSASTEILRSFGLNGLVMKASAPPAAARSAISG